MNISTSIITSMYNRSNEVLRIIEKLFLPSLLNNARKDMELIIIDDCSPLKEETNDLVQKYLPKLKSIFGSVIFIRNTENLGFAKSYNRGIRIAKGKNLLITNDDVYFPVGSIQKLVNTLLFDKCLMVGPVSNNKELWSYQYCRQAPTLNSYFNSSISKLEYFHFYLEKSIINNIKTVDNLCGFCFAIDAVLVKKIGGFDERYKHGYFEDTDLVQRIIKLYGPGHIVINLKVFVGHGGILGSSQTFKQQKLKMVKSLLINGFKYANTWGYGTLLKRTIYGLKSQSGKGTISDLLMDN